MEAGRRTGAVVLHVGLSCRIGAVCTRAGTAAERPGQTGSSEEQLRIIPKIPKEKKKEQKIDKLAILSEGDLYQVTTISSGCCGIEYGNSYRVGWDAVIHEKNKSPDADISPKPTVFLPSIAEIKVQKAGTYLCLLEDFFPDIIKIDWQEKDDKTILTSQQGDTMKTKGAYMKFSWLTVAGASLDKEHKCIVKHESDRTKVNQEILFPSINKDLMAAIQSEGDSQGHSETKQNTDVVTVSPLSSGSFSPIPSAVEPATNSTKDSLTDENAILQLQLTNTSAYYTYVLLLLKSLVYSAIMAVCLLGRPALYGNGKSS